MKDLPIIAKLFAITLTVVIFQAVVLGILKMNFTIYNNFILKNILETVSAKTDFLDRIRHFFLFVAGIYLELIYLLLQLWVLQIFFSFFKRIYLIIRNAVLFPFRLIWSQLFNLFGLSFGRLKQTKDGKLSKILLQTAKNIIEIPNPFRGILVIGGAGSGKSESFAIPLIREFSKQNFTGIVYDFKFPTLAQEVEDYYTENNSDVSRYFLNLSDPKCSHRVNPLNPLYMPYSAYAREYASAITKNLMKESIRKEDFWSRSATDLLTACIWFLKQEHPKYCDLPHVLALIASPYKDLIKLLATNTESRAMIISLVTAVESEASEQIAGVVGTLQGAVAQINTPEFMFIMGGDDFYLGANEPDYKSVITIGSNPTISSTIAPLCSLIISVSSKMMNQPGKEKSFIMLDESPTVFIPNIEVIPNTGRSNKISTVLFVQDLSQLVDGYGKEKADVLFASCANHFYGKVSSSQTADVLSKQFGREDKYFESKSVNRRSDNIFQRNIGKSYSVQQREVFQGSDFMNLSVGQFVGNIAETEEPYIIKQFMPSKKNTKVDLKEKIPTHERLQIDVFYKKVFKEVQDILSGKANLDYENDVDRNELIKQIDKNTDEENTESEPIADNERMTPEEIINELREINAQGYGFESLKDEHKTKPSDETDFSESERQFKESMEFLKRKNHIDNLSNLS